jgi:hypothetical protein
MLGWFWRDPPWVNHDSLAIARGLIHSGHSVMGSGLIAPINSIINSINLGEW